jgi:hypothetical protein
MKDGVLSQGQTGWQWHLWNVSVPWLPEALPMNPFPGLKLHVLPGQAKLKDLPLSDGTAGTFSGEMGHPLDRSSLSWRGKSPTWRQSSMK